jgi:hypothetical protein
MSELKEVMVVFSVFRTRHASDKACENMANMSKEDLRTFVKDSWAPLGERNVDVEAVYIEGKGWIA